uniref:t-SNARE coiled-coil homology domain-containing protein n=1 Tax=Chromera velia CCMP2878 TaxID=1169474 RepID=A0A0G4HC21_9ALVE|mmetsp:Transcript_56113/g.109850  ORF Transcript_56113/g.109850 Transcript_56113/m.109850 type:complete len:315 (+) Transcript_56113:123-1067(+)|eukprot:Cvel_25974.t1-p1 / transcript=Cvel_25974.t1 / gene=Cvel_25974 / organism=Chromera_velia_CCMP2878 / gene_product=Syntaxin, putative / transcript_product=Syntaxin, putative / location=Cvel_scaffold3015:6782-7723(+) / protein_length=314 / sequence_SO=supercontig / SO=protein_coding / is_pseudo=false
MHDRLAELREIARRKNVVQTARTGVSTRNLPEGAADETRDPELGEASTSPPFMADYLERVARIKADIGELHKNVDRIRELKHAAIRATSPEKEKEISAELDEIVSETNRHINILKKSIERMQKDNKVFAEQNRNSSEARIRDNLLQALLRKFRELLVDYQAAQQEFRDEAQKKVERQVKIVYPEANQKQIDEMVEAGADAVIHQRIVRGHETLKGALSDIQDKYKDIQMLETNIKELRQMMVDLATLVESQGDLINQIEYSVASAKDYVAKADQELVSARKWQARARKKMICLTIVLLIAALVILTPVLVVLMR